MRTTPRAERTAVARTRFRDRAEAGDVLAGLLGHYAGRDDVLVLALPRGGVPVAARVARALGAPLDVFVVRKLGVPGHEELAMGAIASGGVQVVNEQVVGRLGWARPTCAGRPSPRAASWPGGNGATGRAGPARPDRPGGDPGRRRPGHRLDDAGGGGRRPPPGPGPGGGRGPHGTALHLPAPPPGGRRGGLCHPAPVQGGRLLLPVVSPDLRRGGQGPPPGRLGDRPRPRPGPDPQGPAGPGPGEPNLDRRS